MADAAHVGAVANAAFPAAAAAGRAGQRHAGVSFHRVLAGAFRTQAAAGSVRGGAARAVARVAPMEKPAAALPAGATAALGQAMAAEAVPQSWQPGLAFIMAQESGGRVDARNPVHSARGLFQLTRANYHLNPHGAASFGNAVEEAQGGIRYIRARYGTADNAVAFWRQHRWY